VIVAFLKTPSARFRRVQVLSQETPWTRRRLHRATLHVTQWGVGGRRGRDLTRLSPLF